MSRLVDQKSVKRTIITMAIPMFAGTFAMNAYNLTDVWFVSLLGTKPLAAMTFTFPVVMLIRFIMMGLTTGASSLISHRLGAKKDEAAAEITTHYLILTIIASLLMIIAGLLSSVFIFKQLGASGETLDLTMQYMNIWFLGIIFVIFPMSCGSIIMATGDTKSASLLIVSGTVINLILDPLFIFGKLGLPAMGIKGAALATILAQTVPSFWGVYLLDKKFNLIQKHKPKLIDIWISWRRVFRFGTPNILSNILQPISVAVITHIIAWYGEAAVAAVGAAGRLEMFAFMIPMTVGMSLVPFIGQNFGAERFDRIKEGMKFSIWFAILYGLFTTIVFYLSAEFLAGIFTKDPEVKIVLVSYIRIISFGYGIMESFRYATFFFIGIHKPSLSALLNVMRVVALLIPLSALGAYLYNTNGVFLGRLITDLTAGGLGLLLLHRWINRLENIS